MNSMIDNNKSELPLSSGKALLAKEADSLAMKELSKLIILAGPPESGKTTLLVFLNNRFQKGPYANYFFKGSQTLLEFEICSHLSRFSPSNTRPYTPRTLNNVLNVEDVRYLHIDLYNINKNNTHSLLFTDISGEVFRTIRDSSEKCKDFSLLKRCDIFTLILDGKEIMEHKKRNFCYNDGFTLLKNCIDSNMLNTNSFVDIVVTKMDLIFGNPNEEDALSFIRYIEDEYRNNFSNQLGKLRFHLTCARLMKSNNKLKSGYGIDNLLNNWIEDEPISNRNIIVHNRIKSQREFLNFNNEK